MMSRRFFASCTLCALTGFIATDVRAETPPLTRKILSQTEGPAEGYTTIIVEVTIAAGMGAPRHTHPGIESGYIVSGGGLLIRDGQDDQPMKPGSGFQIPVKAIHGFKNGPDPTMIVSTYIVKKGEPLATPA